MSLFVKIFSGGEKVRKKACQQEQVELLPEREEMLMKKKEFLKEKIEQELVVVKKNSRRNRRVALQALRRKKLYEKHLKYIDCAVKAMRSACEHIDVVNKVNDLIKGITEEQDGIQDMSDNLYTSVSFGVEFDENELLAELERLEINLDESLFETNRMEEKIPCSKTPSTASPASQSSWHTKAEMDEDEIEDDLEYLRRWANEPS